MGALCSRLDPPNLIVGVSGWISATPGSIPVKIRVPEAAFSGVHAWYSSIMSSIELTHSSITAAPLVIT